MACQGDARGAFRHALAVHRCGVEVIDAMFEGVVDLLVDHLLVDGGVGVVAEGAAALYGETHHAVAKERHLVVRVGVGAVGHLALAVDDVFGDGRTVAVRRAGRKHHRRGDGRTAHMFQEFSSIHCVCCFFCRAVVPRQPLTFFFVRLPRCDSPTTNYPI